LELFHYGLELVRREQELFRDGLKLFCRKQELLDETGEPNRGEEEHFRISKGCLVSGNGWLASHF